MSFLIGIFLAAKGIVFLSGLFAFTASKIEISALQIAVASKKVEVSCSILHAFSPQLCKLAQSGTDIRMYLFVDLKRNRSADSVSSVVAENCLTFDPVRATYRVYRSAQGDTLQFENLDSALNAASVFRRVQTVSLDQIDPSSEYFFSIYAMLGKVRVEALKDAEIDLMYYWNYKRPCLRTKPVAGSAFLQAAVK